MLGSSSVSFSLRVNSQECLTISPQKRLASAFRLRSFWILVLYSEFLYSLKVGQSSESIFSLRISLTNLDTYCCSSQVFLMLLWTRMDSPSTPRWSSCRHMTMYPSCSLVRRKSKAGYLTKALASSWMILVLMTAAQYWQWTMRELLDSSLLFSTSSTAHTLPTGRKMGRIVPIAFLERGEECCLTKSSTDLMMLSECVSVVLPVTQASRQNLLFQDWAKRAMSCRVIFSTSASFSEGEVPLPSLSALVRDSQASWYGLLRKKLAYSFFCFSFRVSNSCESLGVNSNISLRQGLMNLSKESLNPITFMLAVQYELNEKSESSSAISAMQTNSLSFSLSIFSKSDLTTSSLAVFWPSKQILRLSSALGRENSWSSLKKDSMKSDWQFFLGCLWVPRGRTARSEGMKQLGSGKAATQLMGSILPRGSVVNLDWQMGSTWSHSFSKDLDSTSTTRLWGVSWSMYSLMSAGLNSSMRQGQTKSSSTPLLCRFLAAAEQKFMPCFFSWKSNFILLTLLISSTTQLCGSFSRSTPMKQNTYPITSRTCATPLSVSAMLTSNQEQQLQLSEPPADREVASPCEMRKDSSEPLPSWPSTCVTYLAGEERQWGAWSFRNQVISSTLLSCTGTILIIFPIAFSPKGCSLILNREQLLLPTSLNRCSTDCASLSISSWPQTTSFMRLAEQLLRQKLKSISRRLGLARECLSPVENLWQGWSSLERCLVSWYFLHASLCRFLECSECTALSSLSEEESSMRGSMKKREKRSSASWKAPWETSKKKLVSSREVQAFEEPAFLLRN